MCLFARSWIGMKHKTKHCSWKNSPLVIHKIIKKNLLKGKQWNCRWEKMSKAVGEKKLKITTTRFEWQFNLYWNSMCVEEDHKKHSELCGSMAPCMDRIDMSQGYVLLLGCRYLASLKQPPPTPSHTYTPRLFIFFEKITYSRIRTSHLSIFLFF